MTTNNIRTINLPPEEIRQDKIDAVLAELRRCLPEADESDLIYAARRLVEIIRPDLFY